MTRYEKGFLTKCAEYGLGADVSISLMKKTAQTPSGTPVSGRMVDKLTKMPIDRLRALQKNFVNGYPLLTATARQTLIENLVNSGNVRAARAVAARPFNPGAQSAALEGWVRVGRALRNVGQLRGITHPRLGSTLEALVNGLKKVKIK